ncbi:MAG: L-aspartate oxidase [Desulfosarcinaceae bacterium]|jgi:L-aspartate oxidase
MKIETDALIIGSGVAGLLVALKVAEHGRVVVLTKKAAVDSNTNMAQGGIASVFSVDDSFEMHIEDTLKSGDGLCNPDVVRQVIRRGPQMVRELMDLGVRFSQIKPKDGEAVAPPAEDTGLDLGREGGHSQNRIVHARDMTGREVERVLLDQVRSHPNIRLYENHIAIDLIVRSTRMKRGLVTTTHESHCCGVYALERDTQKVLTFGAKLTLLATGGAGKVYLYTSNPDIASGDGIAMAYRAGATVANMEFVQFHPTCLYHPEAKNFLISEAVRGEGGVLRNSAGEAFMAKYDSLKDLACRDVVARAIDTELKTRGDDFVFLDISHREAAFIEERFPNLTANCRRFGIDMTTEPIPVVPAAHYMCGGIATDQFGRTDIHHLYAIGECACTGLHGANRLASNSLLEALVYADSAAAKTIEELRSGRFTETGVETWDEVGTTDSDEQIMVTHNWDEIRRFMWNYVGIVRSDKRLARAKRRMEIIQSEIREYYWDFKVTPDLIELRNLAIVAELIITSALHRKESRGLHYNIGCPRRDDRLWQKDTILRRPFVN